MWEWSPCHTQRFHAQNSSFNSHTNFFKLFVLWLDTVFAFHAVYSAFSLEDQRSVGLEQQNIPPTRLGSVILTIFVLCAARHTFSQGEKRHKEGHHESRETDGRACVFIYLTILYNHGCIRAAKLVTCIERAGGQISGVKTLMCVCVSLHSLGEVLSVGHVVQDLGDSSGGFHVGERHCWQVGLVCSQPSEK